MVQQLATRAILTVKRCYRMRCLSLCRELTTVQKLLPADDLCFGLFATQNVQGSALEQGFYDSALRYSTT